MPEYTGKNLNLVKPLMGDYVEQTIPQLAENMQKIDDKVTDLAGEGRTAETVKGNADAIAALAGEGNTATVKAVADALKSHLSENASTTAKGHIQLATVEEAVAGTDTTKAVTSAGLKAALPISLPANGGNADTADKLATARTITLSGDVTGSASFDGSTNISISATVADDSHNHVISNIDNLQTTLDSKAPLTSPAFTGTPTAPTAPNGTNTNQIATTAFVQNALSVGDYGDMKKSVYDTNDDGKVNKADDADKLGGQLPEYYAKVEDIPDISGKLDNSHNTDTAAHADIRESINTLGADVVAHKAEDVKEAHIGLNDTTISLGLNSNTRNADGEVAIGYGATTGNLGNGSGIGNIAIGFNASTRNNNNYARRGMIAIGDNAKALNSGAIALGQDSSTSEGAGSVAIGRSASATSTSSVAIGRDASATSTGSVAIGRSASATSTSSVAIGNGATAENSYSGVLGGSNTGSSHTVNWIVPGSFTVNGTKNFEIPHPKPEKKATHVIRHSAVESPTPGDTLYRWKVQATKDNDLVTIDLPDYFVWLNKDVQIFVTPQGHFGNGYGILNKETEQLEIHCQYEGEYNVLVIGTRNDDHQSVKDWDIKGVEREIGESWTGETYTFSVDEIMEVEEIKEVSA